MIYLDNNATTPVDPAVREAMLPFLGGVFGNPSSAHGAGRAARAAVEEAREQVAALLDCEPGEIVFTSGGTESINTAVRSALASQPGRRHIVTSVIEHSATKNLCEGLEREGCEVTWLPVDRGGLPEVAAFERALRPDTAIATVLWANNETGVLFPVAEMAAAAAARRVPFHADAVQAAGKIPVGVRGTDIHLLSLSAHKFHGPKGVGALYVNRRLGFRPLLAGGGQEGGRRPGTENVAGIVGLGVAARLARERLPRTTESLRAMRDRFEAAVLERFPGAAVHGDRERRLPNTTNLSLPGIDAGAALLVLDRLGVCCSIGSACSSGAPDASHVLRAMGVDDAGARSSLRFSFGRLNRADDVDGALAALEQAVARMGALRD